MLVFVRRVGAVCVYDHPGDEATLVKQMVSDRSKIALPEYHIDLISESSGVHSAFPQVSSEPMAKRRSFGGRELRDVWASTQIVWGVGAETFAFDAALEGGGTETDCTSDAAYASCLFMLELNFHSGSSITQVSDLEGQTDPDRADILWEASSVMKLVVTVLQQCCLECLVNPTVRSSLIELKFGRGVVDWFILDLYGGISLWLPESLFSDSTKLQVSNAYLEYLKGPRTRILFEFVKEMPKPETKLRLNIASLIGAVFFTWVILLLFPVSSF
ncbi:hypothetical protein F2Q68_00031073 [Brassica cretica]|uniref:Uncharacterized protein n=1 Tax=Brassica cretica TaxID=69181 RepID=A0A8S9G9V0_BRACR|nr:hypothetical protein F2Q68_00031073 [Brassica cretica]